MCVAALLTHYPCFTLTKLTEFQQKIISKVPDTDEKLNWLVEDWADLALMIKKVSLQQA